MTVSPAKNGKASVPLLVFSDDWGRHPSSCQHLIQKFLPYHSVLWVNTIGMRTPSLSWATLKRAWEKIRHWSFKHTSEPANQNGPRILNPKMWPWFGSSFSRMLNRRLLAKSLVPVIQSLPQPPLAITTLPVVSDLIGVLPVARWVYYCVDDFSQWPGLDHSALLAMDEELIRKADTCVAVGETLQERLAARGRSSLLLTHGVDLAFWKPTQDPGQHEALAKLEKPLLVFWGVIDRRLNLDWLRTLAKDLTRGTIVLIGPWSDPDPALASLPRMVHVPPVAFEDLPKIAQSAAVLLMPYADLPVTRAMQPLKLKEYLATGKPVVVADLPANRAWSDCLDVVRDAKQFSETVRRRLETGISSDQLTARQRLADESWAQKAQLFMNWALAKETASHAAACS